MMSLYQIYVEDKDLNVVELKEYKGKVLLIVNTATTCFFTPQY
jgi:glutathione peroxidase